MKHTKGEWKIREQGCHHMIFVTESDNIDTDICRVVDYHNPYNFEQQEANAKLIVAAPELLKALEIIRDSLGVPISQKTVKALFGLTNKAIKKATE